MTTSWYDRHILPWALDIACGLRAVERQRRKVRAGMVWVSSAVDVLANTVPRSKSSPIRWFWFSTLTLKWLIPTDLRVFRKHFLSMTKW